MTKRMERMARILVLDEEPSMAEIIGRALEALGHEAWIYADPHLAIDALADGFAHDLLIAERWMTGLGGDEVARWAKALRPSLPVILMSGVRPVVAEPARADAILCKPFSIEELEAVVDRALAASHRAN